jgi:tRNA(Ile)-lysidine synthase
MVNKKPKTTLEKRVLQFIRRQELIKSGQKVLVAVSGGPDSVCLLNVLAKLRSDLGFTLHIAHLNHQLRGEEAESDEQYVADLAREMKIPATIEKRDVSSYQIEHSLSLEEAAREVRYHFLAQTAQAVEAASVAVGHTLSDQVETILLHIIRGSGTRGLRGLQPSYDLQFSGEQLKVIRPLLEIDRYETGEYCSDLDLMPCLDTSNLSFTILRNRVRQELLPLLETYNPGISESILRISDIAQDDLAFIEAESEKAWQKIVRQEENTLILDKKGFKLLAPALRRQILRKGIEVLLGTLKDIETRHIEEILKVLRKPAGKQISLPEGLIFSVEYDRYLLSFNPQELDPFPPLEGEYEINIPGETRLPGWQIEASVIASNAIDRGTGVPACDLDPVPGLLKSVSNFTACFDQKQLGNKIKIRARLPGDRFQPLGMKESKKVGEFMQDARIPQTWRPKIPIVFSPNQIIWVAGWRIDDRVKVTGKTRQVLCLKMVRCQEPSVDQILQ